MGRRRKKEPRRNQLCLRLTDKQLDLLQSYQSVRGKDSEVDAVRLMIDGLEDWLERHHAAKAASASHQPERAHSRVSSARDTSVPPATDGPMASSVESDEGTSLGDFGGQPRLKLPGLPSDGELQ